MARGTRAKPMKGGTIIGEVIKVGLDKMRPNDWNPNVFTPDEYIALKHGMKKRGWLASHAMTVWGVDDKGRRQDIIVDGEHRWLAAREIGMTEGPASYVNGLSRAEAMALTVELDKKRGKFDPTRLATAVRYIKENLITETLALDLGFTENQLKIMLEPEKISSGSVTSERNERQAVLYYDPASYQVFTDCISKLQKRHEGKSLSAMVLHLVREATA